MLECSNIMQPCKDVGKRKRASKKLWAQNKARSILNSPKYTLLLKEAHWTANNAGTGNFRHSINLDSSSAVQRQDSKQDKLESVMNTGNSILQVVGSKAFSSRENLIYYFPFLSCG